MVKKTGKRVRMPRRVPADTIKKPVPRDAGESPNRGPSSQRWLWASVTAKMITFSAAVYLIITAFYLLITWRSPADTPAEILGLPVEWIKLGGQVLILAVSLTIASRLFLEKPIKKIKGTIQELMRGDYLARAKIDASDEIGELASNINKMLSHVTDLNLEKIKTEYELMKIKEDLRRIAKGNRAEKIPAENRKKLPPQIKDFSLLYEIGQRINSTMEIAELYRTIEEVLPTQLNLQRFAILLVDENGEFLNVKAAHGFENNERIYELVFRLGEGISGEAALKGETIYIPDANAESKFLHYRGESMETGSLLTVPLKYKRDILGVINFSRAEKDAFSNEDIKLLTLIANQIALAVENAELYTKTRELSVRDELTGLYNRRHFQQMLQMEWKRATRFKRPLSLLMIDVDHFKEFNDNFGHKHGDNVLKLIANLLIKNLREVDTTSRFGGEEFVILLPDTDKNGSAVVGEKLRRLVEIERFENHSRNFMPLTISIGISVFPDDAMEMDDLINHADIALYDAKDGGRNCVMVYAEEITDVSEKMGRPLWASR